MLGMTIDQNGKIKLTCPCCGNLYEPRSTSFPLEICGPCEHDTQKKIAERDAMMKNPLKKDN